MTRDKEAEYNPFALNILRLQQYNFGCFGLEEVVFFEYMAVKAISFKHKPFFHAARTISEETGIKKAKLATIIRRFEKEGFINTEVSGFPKVTFFTVDFEKIYESIGRIYRLPAGNTPSPEKDKLLNCFARLALRYRQQREATKARQQSVADTGIIKNTATQRREMATV